jgi:hypothetical protein
MRLSFFSILFFSFLSVCLGIETGHTIVIKETVEVPGDYSTIQAAVEACNEDGGGWRILVDDDTWKENIVIDGSDSDGYEWTNKVIIIKSARGNPDDCIIDGDSSGSCISVIDANAIITGFTITNGTGSVDTFDNQEVTFGGGIGVQPHTWFDIDNCKIMNNRIVGASDTGYSMGGGLFIRPYIDGTKVDVSITNCEILNNVANPYASSGTDPAENCWGGGVCCLRADAGSNIQFCEFLDNSSDDFGGGLHIGHCKTIKVGYNKFKGNYTKRNVPGRGMAIYASDFLNTQEGILILRNNMIYENGDDSEASKSDAIFIIDVSKAFVTNNTIANNNSDNSSAVLVQSEDINCNIDLFNNIVYDNDISSTGYQILFEDISSYYLTIEIAFNSIENQSYMYSGTYQEDYYNDDFSPNFNSTYHLTSSSSCIEHGVDPSNNNYQYVQDAYITYSDYDGNRRPLDGDGDNNWDFDLGADEYVP